MEPLTGKLLEAEDILKKATAAGEHNSPVPPHSLLLRGWVGRGLTHPSKETTDGVFMDNPTCAWIIIGLHRTKYLSPPDFYCATTNLENISSVTDLRIFHMSLIAS